jgi:hypothetical protein
MSSSFDSSMHTKSIDVALGFVYSLTNQHCLLLHKNSTTRFLIIYVLNYHLHKLYLRIICLHFCTFQMRRQPYSQQLNIQHFSSLYSSQLLFYFYYFQQFWFLFLPLFVLIPLRFLFSYYSL